MLQRALAPIQRFLAIQAASGIVLLLAAALALFWANSPGAHAYQALWHFALPLELGGLRFERDLHFWINDGLMTIFFFVVGLEIRREMHGGELSEPRRAALPLVAAAGGMLLPALIYYASNRGLDSVRGWGVPMATDIAFAVGILALLGKRVPPALRVLLLALAVIDDVGAILVIALFYASGFALHGFAIAAGGVLLVLLQRRIGLRNPWLYVPAGAVVWAGAYAGGVHPTLAGVLLGILTPVVAGPEEASSPLERLEHALHGKVAFGIMPLFALANAGVPLGAASFEGEALHAFIGVFFGLAAGKVLGILGLSWLAVKLGAADLPRGVDFAQVGLVGALAGIGFTMALFIAQLAFPAGSAALETVKLAILSASGLCAGLGYAFGHMILPATVPLEAAQSELEAEQSTLH
jgi:Na+:H+ antiporter, NhaA family